MLKRSDLADPLSDILALVKPRSVACGAVDAGDVHLTFPRDNGIKCHAVIEGKAWLLVEGIASPYRIGAGDFILLPHGRAYALASDLNLASVDYQTVLAGGSPGHLLTYNGGGCATLISVAFTVDRGHAEMLLKVLPPVVHLQADVGQSALSQSLNQSLNQSLHQMMREFRKPQPGSRLIVEHLTTMVLAQALRAYLAHIGPGNVGWLFALADEWIGTAIGAMHADPSYRWSVQDLAHRAGLGRTSFSNRFKYTVGCPPMEYLSQLRMMLARERLSTSNDTVNQIAEAVGYESESSFSSAFKRRVGCAPGHYAKTTRVA